MIVVDRARTRWSGTPADWERLQDELRRHTCVHVPGFLDPALLAQIRGLLSRTHFTEHRHGELSVDERAVPGRLSALLMFVLNDARLLNIVERLTGCAGLGGFDGTVYRLLPGGRHFDSWHSDSGSQRRVALSINLNDGVVPTAPLQIRRRGCETTLHEFANAVPGDAVLFTVDDEHEHRIKPMDGMAARIACAGWFHGGKGLRARLEEAARQPAAD